MVYAAEGAPPWRVRFVSQNFRTKLGYAPHQFIDDPNFWPDHVHPEDWPRVRAQFEDIESSGTIQLEYRFRLADGTYRWMRDEATIVGDDAGQPAGLVGYWIDISEQKRVELQLRESEDRLRESRAYLEHLVSASPAIIFSAQATPPYSTRFVSANVERVLGYRAEQFVADSSFWPSRVHPDDMTAELARLRDAQPGELLTCEYRFRHADGTYRWMTSQAQVVAGTADTGPELVGYWLDITDGKQLEEQFRQAQKMEAVGRLAGGVAHDFNNMLTAILGYCDLLLDEMRPDHPLRPEVEEIRHAGESAASLTRQLLTFSRRQVLAPEPLSPNAVISEMTKILQRTIGEDVRLDTALASDACSCSVVADRGQLEQVLMNLAVNARDAMPRGGVLTIGASRVSLDSPATHDRGTVPPGDFCLVTVRDSGCGMTPDVLSHIFEPFYTTKGQGEGTGLGLPSVYGIVTQSGGHVAVDSAVGKGTTVFIYLPVASAPAIARAAGAPPRTHASGSETILVVEDHRVIRELIRRVLTSHGYVVVTASDGGRAVQVAHGSPIDLLLTDVVMPGISGIDLAAKLMTMRPGIACLFTSGYTDESLLHHGFDRGAAFLPKPFTPTTLLAAVRGALDSRSTSSGMPLPRAS